jgi:hypothetical protein
MMRTTDYNPLPCKSEYFFFLSLSRLNLKACCCFGELLATMKIYMSNKICECKESNCVSYISDTTNCCESRSRNPNCFTISIPTVDRFYSWVNNTAECLNLIRSTPVCNGNTREQYNDLTSFVDASNIYGSDKDHAAILR